MLQCQNRGVRANGDMAAWDQSPAAKQPAQPPANGPPKMGGIDEDKAETLSPLPLLRLFEKQKSTTRRIVEGDTSPSTVHAMPQKPMPLSLCVPHAPVHCRTSTALALPGSPHPHKPAEPTPELHRYTRNRAFTACTEVARKSAKRGGAMPLAVCKASGRGPEGLRVAGQLAKNNQLNKASPRRKKKRKKNAYLKIGPVPYPNSSTTIALPSSTSGSCQNDENRMAKKPSEI